MTREVLTSKNSSDAMDDRRHLFPPFFDPVDMIGLFSSNSPLQDVLNTAEAYGLTFPLLFDPAVSLSGHMACSDYAPASARFGPFVDNVIGMNWQLPSGRVVRIGERVVKSTTGYDLLRFLLHSDGRYGQGKDYVLRLRPLAPSSVQLRFDGDATALFKLHQRLALGAWAHWLDRVDEIYRAGEAPFIEVESRCLKGEEELFLDYFRSTALEAGCRIAEAESTPLKMPVLSIKSTANTVDSLALRCCERFGTTCRALLFNGVVLVDLAVGDLNAFKQSHEIFLNALAKEVESYGGHLMGAAAPQPSVNPLERDWSARIEKAWGNL